MFVALLGLHFFKHRFCIDLGSSFDEFWDRPFGGNLIFKMDSLQKNKDSQVPILLLFFNDFPIEIDQFVHHFSTILVYFSNILETSILAPVLTDVGSPMLPNPSFRQLFVPRKIQTPSPPNYQERSRGLFKAF